MEKKRLQVAVALTVFFTGVFGLLIFWLAQRITGGTGLFATILLVVLSLVVALVLTGVLRAAGVITTAKSTFSGAAAVFFGCFTVSFAAYQNVPEERWPIELILSGFPDDVAGSIEANNGCAVRFPAGLQRVQLDLHGACRGEKLTFTVTADGTKPFEIGPIASVDARNAGVRIVWIGEAKPRFLGTVLSAQTAAPVEGAKVTLVGCAALPSVTTDRAGGFELDNIPSKCLDATEVLIEHAGHAELYPTKKNESVKITIDSSVIVKVVANDQELVSELVVSTPMATGIYTVGSLALTTSTVFLWSPNGHQAVRASVVGSNIELVALQGKAAGLKRLAPLEVKNALMGRIESGLSPAELGQLATWLVGAGDAGADARVAIEKHCQDRSQQVATRILAESNPSDARGFCKLFAEIEAWDTCSKGSEQGRKNQLEMTRNLYCAAAHR